VGRPEAFSEQDKKMRPDKILNLLKEEEKRQEETVNMVASENYPDMRILKAYSSIISNRYSEGYVGKRYYAGTKVVDKIEGIAVDKVKRLFGSEHANVQPHSGTQANMAVMMSILKPGDRILSMDLACGGHISHGNRLSIAANLFKTMHYGVDKKNGRIDYEDVRKKAIKFKPSLIIAGGSSYPRGIDFKKFRDICDETGAYLLCDIAHTAGLVCAGLHQNPCDFADFVTFTTHKSMKGPRGGVILCKDKYAKQIDRAVFPGTQGGSLNSNIAGKAICFEIAATGRFKRYIKRVIQNSRILCRLLKERGVNIVTNGSDTHIILISLENTNTNGHAVQEALEKAGIMSNKNLIPFDKGSPKKPSGIRIGTLGLTSRGFTKKDIHRLSEIISYAVKNPEDEDGMIKRKKIVTKICKKHPIYKRNNKKC